MKNISSIQIVQLREHDLNRGHNKSQTPIYPKTHVNAIDGIEELNIGAKSIPNISGDDLPIHHNDSEHLNTFNTYDLSAGVYYDLGTPTNIAPIDSPADYSITLYFPERAADSNNAYCYFGRFTAPADDIGITLKDGVHFPDEHPDIEAGHTYEFSVLYDTFLITDITYTPNNG